MIAIWQCRSWRRLDHRTMLEVSLFTATLVSTIILEGLTNTSATLVASWLQVRYILVDALLFVCCYEWICSARALLDNNKILFRNTFLLLLRSMPYWPLLFCKLSLKQTSGCSSTLPNMLGQLSSPGLAYVRLPLCSMVIWVPVRMQLAVCAAEAVVQVLLRHWLSNVESSTGVWVRFGLRLVLLLSHSAMVGWWVLPALRGWHAVSEAQRRLLHKSAGLYPDEPREIAISSTPAPGCSCTTITCSNTAEEDVALNLPAMAWQALTATSNTCCIMPHPAQRSVVPVQAVPQAPLQPSRQNQCLSLISEAAAKADDGQRLEDVVEVLQHNLQQLLRTPPFQAHKVDGQYGLYHAAAVCSNAAVKVVCGDSAHDEVQVAMLQRTAAEVAAILAASQQLGSAVSRAACVRGCVLLLVWVRQLPLSYWTQPAQLAAGGAHRMHAEEQPEISGSCGLVPGSSDSTPGGSWHPPLGSLEATLPQKKSVEQGVDRHELTTEETILTAHDATPASPAARICRQAVDSCRLIDGGVGSVRATTETAVCTWQPNTDTYELTTDCRGPEPCSVSPSCVLLQPPCLVAGQAAQVTVWLQGLPASLETVRVALLGADCQLVADKESSPLEAGAAGCQVARICVPAICEGLAYLLVEPRGSCSAPLLLPVLCLPAPAAQEMAGLLHQPLSSRQPDTALAADAGSSPDPDVTAMQAWQDTVKGLVSDIAYLIEVRTSASAAAGAQPDSGSSSNILQGASGEMLTGLLMFFTEHELKALFEAVLRQLVRPPVPAHDDIPGGSRVEITELPPGSVHTAAGSGGDELPSGTGAAPSSAGVAQGAVAVSGGEAVMPSTGLEPSLGRAAGMQAGTAARTASAAVDPMHAAPLPMLHDGVNGMEHAGCNGACCKGHAGAPHLVHGNGREEHAGPSRQLLGLLRQTSQTRDEDGTVQAEAVRHPQALWHAALFGFRDNLLEARYRQGAQQQSGRMTRLLCVLCLLASLASVHARVGSSPDSVPLWPHYLLHTMWLLLLLPSHSTSKLPVRLHGWPLVVVAVLLALETVFAVAARALPVAGVALHLRQAMAYEFLPCIVRHAILQTDLPHCATIAVMHQLGKAATTGCWPCSGRLLCPADFVPVLVTLPLLLAFEMRQRATMLRQPAPAVHAKVQ